MFNERQNNMKKYTIAFLFLSVILLSFTACDDGDDITKPFIEFTDYNDIIEIDEDAKSANIYVGSNGGSLSITVNSNIEWYVLAEDENWLAVRRVNDMLKVTVPSYRMSESRSARVYLIDELNNILGSVMVYQAELDRDQTDLEVKLQGDDQVVFFPGRESEYQIEVLTNKDWTVNTTEPWLTIIEDQENNTFKIVSDANPLFSDRLATVTISAGTDQNDVITMDLEIKQFCTDDAMVLTVRTEQPGDSVVLPINDLYLAPNVNCLVEWGDGTMTHVFLARPIHSYAEPGTYEVRIYGKVESLASNVGIISDQILKDRIIAVNNWGNTGLKYMRSAFSNCENLEYIAKPNEDSFVQLVDAYRAFYGCISLTEIPEGMFENAPMLRTMSNTFAMTEKITFVPRLFGNNPSLTSVTRLFWRGSVEEISEDLLKGCTALIDASLIFYRNENLKSIPKNLFADSPNITNFSNAFGNCLSLVDVPEELFATNTNVTNFSSLFNGNVSLKSIPENLFATNIKATNFTSAFAGTSLKEIPADLFATNINVTNFSNLFNGNNTLTAVPSNLFDNNEKVTTFSGVFRDCVNLKSVPISIFDNNRVVTSFSHAFNGCVELEGESPYTLIGDVKVHLYERGDYLNDFTNVKTVTDCFKDCTKFIDYNTISSYYPDWI